MDIDPPSVSSSMHRVADKLVSVEREVTQLRERMAYEPVKASAGIVEDLILLTGQVVELTKLFRALAEYQS